MRGAQFHELTQNLRGQTEERAHKTSFELASGPVETRTCRQPNTVQKE
jgi:hypothetical protein